MRFTRGCPGTWRHVMKRLTKKTILIVGLAALASGCTFSAFQASCAYAYNSDALTQIDTTQDVSFFNPYTSDPNTGEPQYIYPPGDKQPTSPGHNLPVVNDSTDSTRRTERNARIFETGGIGEAQYANITKWRNNIIALGPTDTFGLFFSDASNHYFQHTRNFHDGFDHDGFDHDGFDHGRGSHRWHGGGGVDPVPIPHTVLLFGSGLFGLAILAKRRGKSAPGHDCS